MPPPRPSKPKPLPKLSIDQKQGKAALNTFAQLAAFFKPPEEPKAPQAPKMEETPKVEEAPTQETHAPAAEGHGTAESEATNGA